MGEPLSFDAGMAATLERIYATRDVVRRRRAVQHALAAQPGEAILDVGCGPGFYVAEILDLVGPAGEVAAVDSSAAMLAMTAARIEGTGSAELVEAEATALPFDDARFDAVVSVQVLEYVTEVEKALVEMQRVLRPGGRVVLWDVDWSTLSLHALDASRSERVVSAWDTHLHDPVLPRTLAARMRGAGFADVAFEPHVFATGELTSEAYGGAAVSLIAQYAATQDAVGPDEAAAWEQEMRALEAGGAFFCAVTQFCFTGAVAG